MLGVIVLRGPLLKLEIRPMDGLSHIELLLVSAVSLWADHLVEKGDAMREDVTQHEDGLDLPHTQLGRKNVIEPCARLHVAECDESVHS